MAGHRVRHIRARGAGRESRDLLGTLRRSGVHRRPHRAIRFASQDQPCAGVDTRNFQSEGDAVAVGPNLRYWPWALIHCLTSTHTTRGLCKVLANYNQR
jgi:hypothetical protein